MYSLMWKTFLFRAIHFSQAVLIQLIQFSISTYFLHIVKCQNNSMLNNSVYVNTVSKSKNRSIWNNSV